MYVIAAPCARPIFKQIRISVYTFRTCLSVLDGAGLFYISIAVFPLLWRVTKCRGKKKSTSKSLVTIFLNTDSDRVDSTSQEIIPTCVKMETCHKFSIPSSLSNCSRLGNYFVICSWHVIILPTNILCPLIAGEYLHERRHFSLRNDLAK